MGYETFYTGGYSSLNPEYGNFIGYRLPFSEIGTSMDARTANQLKETSEHLNSGIKVFEVAAHSPEVFDAMPKEQFTEIRRLAKLTGTEATMHAPMIDPTGITQQGFDKMNQELAQRQLTEAVERGHELNPNGNVVITMHASTVGLPPAEQKIKTKDGEKVKSILLVNPAGKLAQIKEEEKYFPENEKFTGKPVEFNPGERVKQLNKEQWYESLQQATYYSDFAEERIKEIEKTKKVLNEQLSKENEEWHGEVDHLKESLNKNAEHSMVYLRRSYNNLKELFDLAYKNSKGEDRAKLDEFAKEIAPHVKDFNQVLKEPDDVLKFSQMVERGTRILGSIKDPQIFVPLTEFARDKSAETIANVAFDSFKKFKDSTPIISIENHPAGQSLLTTGEDLKVVVESAREKFVENAIKSKEQGGLGLSKGDAKKQADKIIGVTWDVGHINMLRRYGYDSEDILKETKKVAKLVKHVHLSDNFGFEHTELPMGMGNVPIKEIMQNLGKEGFKGKKVVEALSWWQHFSPGGKTNHALVPTMRAFGSPVYGMEMGPYWNQVSGTMGGYLGFPMSYLPEKHFSMYGTGFSSLPEELGGQIPGTQSRFSGTPNA